MEKIKQILQDFLHEKDKKKWLKEVGINRLVIFFLCGVLLLIIALPEGFLAGEDNRIFGSGEGKKEEGKEEEKNQDSYEEGYERKMESRLKTLLEQAYGVGSVEVMVTLASSTEDVTLKDTPYTKDTLNESDAQGGSRSSISIQQEESSVIVEDGEGNGVPYVTKTLEPKIEGIVVLAEGADKAEIKNEIIEAVEVLFPVSVHKIKVMKLQGYSED